MSPLLQTLHAPVCIGGSRRKGDSNEESRTNQAKGKFIFANRGSAPELANPSIRTLGFSPAEIGFRNIDVD